MKSICSVVALSIFLSFTLSHSSPSSSFSPIRQFKRTLMAWVVASEWVYDDGRVAATKPIHRYNLDVINCSNSNIHTVLYLREQVADFEPFKSSNINCVCGSCVLRREGETIYRRCDYVIITHLQSIFWLDSAVSFHSYHWSVFFFFFSVHSNKIRLFCLAHFNDRGKTLPNTQH